MKEHQEISNNEKLEDGDVICKSCNGTGIEEIKNEYVEYYDRGFVHKVPSLSSIVFCKKCLGSGKLDWIENVTGKKSDNG
jgi:hypothetical protein